MVSMVQPSFKLLILEKAAAEGSNFLNTTDSIGREQSLFFLQFSSHYSFSLHSVCVLYRLSVRIKHRTSHVACDLQVDCCR